MWVRECSFLFQLVIAFRVVNYAFMKSLRIFGQSLFH